MPNTTNYTWVLPTPGANDGTWGGILNTAFEAIDTDLHAVEVKADATLTPTVVTVAIGAGATEDLDLAVARYFRVSTTGLAPTARLINAPASGCTVMVRVSQGNALWVPTFTAPPGTVISPGGVAAPTLINPGSTPYLVRLDTFDGVQWMRTILGSNYGGA